MNSFLLKKIVTKNARQVRWSSSQPVAASKNEITTKLIDDNIVPFLEPAFNFAAFTNKSETLQQLVNLGVDLTKIEKRKGLPQFLLRLDFERDIKHHITFLNDLGIPANTYGRFITKNPLFFKESIEDLGMYISMLLSILFFIIL